MPTLRKQKLVKPILKKTWVTTRMHHLNVLTKMTLAVEHIARRGRTDLAPHFDPAPWGLPDTGEVSENVRGFFAAQFPVEGKDYMGCVLHDIFDEIDLNVSVLREAYFNMPSEAQLARFEYAIFWAFVFEEPLVARLLTDIAIQPTPVFAPEYIEQVGEQGIREMEFEVRSAAVHSLERTAPRTEEGREPWVEALYAVVSEAESQ